MARTSRHSAPFMSVARDHGEGEVVIDDYGRAGRPLVASTTRSTRGMFRRAMVELAKLHRAAGAKEIMTLYQQPLVLARRR